jgi:hypothetical protein
VFNDARVAYGTAELTSKASTSCASSWTNMAAGGTAHLRQRRVPQGPAHTPIFMNEQHFTQRRIAHQTRSVVIAACNRAGCMRPLRTRLTPVLTAAPCAAIAQPR